MINNQVNLNKDSKKDSFKPKATWIQKCEYDSESRVMSITFVNGSQYNYLNVFKPTWDSFKESPDHGTYYSRAIKGRLSSVPVVRQPVGQPKSTPLKVNKQKRSLSHGRNNLTAGLDRSIKRSGLIPDSLK